MFKMNLMPSNPPPPPPRSPQFQKPRKNDEVKPWKSWFAWHPVKINGKWHWLKTIFRQEGPYSYYKKGAGADWRYASDTFDLFQKSK